MKRYLLSLALLCLVATGAHAYWQSRAQVAIVAGGGGYTGPLDVAGSASFAYCLRACSAAAIGTNVIDIKRASDSTTQTFISLADGSLDIASITTFLTATTGRVTKWWDQSGNANHAIQLAANPLPVFTISASGLGTKPAVTFTSGTDESFSTTSSVTMSQPFFFEGVAIRRGGTNFAQMVGIGGSSPSLLFSNSANTMSVFGGSLATFTVADSTFHAVGGLFNGAASQGYVNGVGSGAISDGGATPGAVLWIGLWSSPTLNGDICEVIGWNSDQSGNAAALSANQRSASGYNF